MTQTDRAVPASEPARDPILDILAATTAVVSSPPALEISRERGRIFKAVLTRTAAPTMSAAVDVITETLDVAVEASGTHRDELWRRVCVRLAAQVE